ncbi:MAG: hypothetical protein ACLGHL_09580 [Actinomycetota bacterium]
MRDKRWLRLLVTGLVALLVLGACSDDGSDSSNDEAEGNKVVTEEEGEVVEVKYNVWDDTDKNPPEDVELIAAGQEAWEPNLKKGADAEVIADAIVGENLEFTLYPDGRDGAEIQAEIFIDPEVLPRTDEPLDVIVYIEDDQVVIESGFVGYSETFSREA